MAGLTDTGFSIKILRDCLSDINARLVTVFGPSINTNPQSVFGQLAGVFSERLADAWELALDDWNAGDPDTATGISFINLASINGVTQLGATYSQVSARLFGTAGTVVPTGTIFSVNGNTTAQFQTLAPVTLGAGIGEVQRITWASVPVAGAYTLQLYRGITASLAYNANAAAIQTALTAAIVTLCPAATVTVTGDYTVGFTFTFGGGFGLQPQPLISLPTNTTGVTPTAAELTTGVSQAEVVVQSLTIGPNLANAFTLTNIVTSVAGLASALNAVDATLGRNLETIPAMKIRRAQQLATAGAGTVAAIKSKLAKVAGVAAVVVFENDTDLTDSGGRPPHSLEVVAQNGAASDIAATLYACKGDGMGLFGNTSGTTLDSNGYAKVIAFSRPTLVVIYLTLNVTRDTTGEGNTFPVNGSALIQAAAIAYINKLGIGRDVIVTPGLIAALSAVPGIYGVTVAIGTSASPTLSSNIPITANQVANLDSSHLVVNVS